MLGAPKWLWALVGISAVVSAGMLLVAWSIARSREKGSGGAPQAAVVNARDLLRDYADNPARADDQYRGGPVRVRGKISGFLGRNTFLLEHAPAITCFGLSHNDVASVNVGDEVTVEGRVSLGNAGGVHLRSCRLVR